MAPKTMATRTPLEEIKIADSRFLGFCFSVESTEEVHEYRNKLKYSHPDAAHIPVIWFFGQENSGSDGDILGEKNIKWDEDGEPPDSVGPGMALEVVLFFAEKKTHDFKQQHFAKKGLMIGIVRYFGDRLLGVTCGRLGGCYRSILRKTLHRRFFPDLPLEIDLTSLPEKDIYGMGAGDCELILNIVEDDLPSATANKDSNRGGKVALPSLVDRLLSELQFDCFEGAAGEELPRLQNLQADLTSGFIPIYRYPGNYSGDKWTTFEWSPTSLQVKLAVEERLKPLICQTMNHCVTNYYRDGTDFIAHHGDKDLDLNREGAIVSVSLGETRILELRRRAEPKDLFRLILPHRSMFVLGPHTNREWTHSILPKEGSQGIRLSLTMRDATTFQDLTTGRLFGAGVVTKTLDEIRMRTLLENTTCFAAFCALSASMASKRGLAAGNIALVGTFVLGIFGLRLASNAIRGKHEERCARDFFSKNSSSGTKY
jgi:putative IMPACT (imprinted ancient) family translation regulator